MSEAEGQPANGGEEPLPREFMILLNPDHRIYQRVDSQAFGDFAMSVLDAIKGHFAASPGGPGFDLQVACAVLPGGRLLIELQTLPRMGQSDELDRLRERLQGLPRPRVSGGPVGFASRDMIRGGCAEGELAFAFPFSSLARPGDARLLDDVLMEAGGVAPQRSWWAGIKRAIGLGSG